MATHARIEAHNLDASLLPSYAGEAHTEAFLAESVLSAINAAVQDCSIIAVHTHAGRLYERKGEHLIAALGEQPDPKYRVTGDLYLEIGVRVQSHASAPVHDAFRLVETRSNAAYLAQKEAELARADTDLASAQKHRDAIAAEIARLRN